MAKADDGPDGCRRAAAFLLALDSDSAAQVMQHLDENEIANLTREMASLGRLNGSEMEEALRAFAQAMASDGLNLNSAMQGLLEQVMGKEKGRELYAKARRAAGAELPFRSLSTLSAEQIRKLTGGEHPQVQALVIGSLDAELGAQVLKGMDEEIRYDVVRRMAATGDMPDELVRQVETMMDQRVRLLGKSVSAEDNKARFKTVAQMLTVGEPEIAKAVLERLLQDAPVEAGEIQALMFVIEDILKIGDRDLQKILSEVDKADLVLALKAAPQEVADKLLGNLSSRARDNIKEEIELLGPRPLAEVEEAQKRLLAHIRSMEERGDIKVNRGGGEVMV